MSNNLFVFYHCYSELVHLFMGSILTFKISLDLVSHISLYSWNSMTKDLKFSSLSFMIGITTSICFERFSMTFLFTLIKKYIVLNYTLTRTYWSSIENLKEKVLQCNSMITSHRLKVNKIHVKLLWILKLAFFF